MTSARQTPVSPPDATTLSRRRFIALPAAISAGIAIPGVTMAATGAEEQLFADGAPEWLSLAYWPGSERLDGFAHLSHAVEGMLVDMRNEPLTASECTPPVCEGLVDAASLPTGDPLLALGGVTVRIHGLFHANGVRLERQTSLAMYVHAPSRSGPAFYAWGFDGHSLSTSQPTTFVVPVQAGSGLRLSFELDGATPARRRGLTPNQREYFDDHLFVHLVPGADPGEPKLRRGVYLLAWSDAGRRPTPDWRGYNMAVATSPEDQAPAARSTHSETTAADESPPDDTAPARVYSRLAPWTSIGPPDFAYLLISIEGA